MPAGPVFFQIPARAPACDPLTHALATAGWDTYVAATQVLLAQPEFQIDALHAHIDRLSLLIEDAIRDDPNGLAFFEWRAAVIKVKQDVVAMRADLEATIGA